MEFTETSSASSDNREIPTDSHGKNFQANVSKFYATIATVSKNIRKDDWTYLQRHPEIRAIIRVITTEAIRSKPSNIHLFTANLFNSANDKDLIKKINKQLKAINEQTRGGDWTQADGVMSFSESSETSTQNNCPPTDFSATANRKTEMYERPVCPEDLQPPTCK